MRFAADFLAHHDYLLDGADSDSVNFGSNPGPSASQSCLWGFISPLARTADISAGWPDAPDTICGRGGCTRDFGCDRHENLSGAISWLTFFAGGAADVRRSQSDWRRELAESTICFRRKPRSFRCSAQSVGSRGG